MAVMLFTLGNPLMGVYLMLAVVSYLRPTEQLNLCRMHLIRPVPPTMPHMTLLVASSDLNVPTKTGIYDGSVTLDFPYWSWLEPVLLKLKAGAPTDKLFPFTYHHYATEFRKAAKELQIPNLTP